MTEDAPFTLTRRDLFATTGGVLSAVRTLAAGTISAEVLPENNEVPHPAKPRHRPQWWREDGLVMAGLDWESMLIRLRGGNPNFPQAFVSYDENVAIWRHEHSRKIAVRLKEMGFNFVMIPLYKGGGLKTERNSMEDAKQFTAVCHELGLRVGCYMFSGTVLYESMLAEIPEAKDWFILDHDGKYATYEPWYFRRWVNRGHPGFQAHLRQVVQFAVEEAKMDLLHFDNYYIGPGYEEYSVRQFREYLGKKYSPAERARRFGFTELSHIQPPPAPPQVDVYNGDPLYQDFVDYRCEALSDTYRDLADYARSLNPEVVVECNPGEYMGELNTSLGIGSADHARLIGWGNAYWDEGQPTVLEDGVMTSHFRSHIIGRQFNNMVFHYTGDRVAIAESMANNLQCLGCPAWVTGDEVMPSTILYTSDAKQFEPGVMESIRFFHDHQQYYRDADPVSDVAVLNTFANTAYGPAVTRKKWAALTQSLYQGKIPFTLISDPLPRDLSRFRVVVLADLALISEGLLSGVRSYVQQGGGLVMTGQAASMDEHGYPRKQTTVAELFAEPLKDKTLHAKPGKGRAVYVPQILIPEKFRPGMLPTNRAELLEAVNWAANGPLQVEVTAPDNVTMNLYSQPSGDRILHLVNYDKKKPAKDIKVVLQLSSPKPVPSVKVLSPDFEPTNPGD